MQRMCVRHGQRLRLGPHELINIFFTDGRSNMTEEQIDYIFWKCIDILNYICSVTGMSYELLNILVFVIGQPALILLFYTLWRFERWRRRSC